MNAEKLQEYVLLALGKVSTGALNDAQVIAVGEQLIAEILALVPPAPPPPVQ